MAEFRGNNEGIGAGGELTLAQELWILLNSGKNIIESNPQATEKKVLAMIIDADSDIVITKEP